MTAAVVDLDPPARALPIAPDRSVRDGRDAYLAENGFSVAAYDDAWTEASFFGLDFKVPNTRRHRRALMRHDLHHVATGYGTDLAGEAELSAWEIRTGLRGVDLYVGSIIVAGAMAGLVLYPRRTLAAWRQGREAKANLFGDPLAYAELLDLDVAGLRARMGVAREGVYRGTRGLHPNAPRS